MRVGRQGLVAGVVVLGLVAIVLLWRRAASDRRPTGVPAVEAGASRGEPDEPAAASSGVRSPDGAPKLAEDADLEPLRRTRRDRAARDVVRERIYRAFGEPLPGRASSPWRPVGDAGALDKDYVRARIREDFLPLAKECYEAALERDKTLAGKLVFDFVIVGDEEVGGIVESAEPAEGSSLAEAELITCMRESLLSLSFAPPPNGGKVTVRYPFEFAP